MRVKTNCIQGPRTDLIIVGIIGVVKRMSYALIFYSYSLINFPLIHIFTLTVSLV